MEETTLHFIGKWVFRIPGEIMDRLDKEFDIDYSSSDVESAICFLDLSNPDLVGDVIWEWYVDLLKARLQEMYEDFDETLFESVNCGADACDVYYNGQRFKTREQFEAAYRLATCQVD